VYILVVEKRLVFKKYFLKTKMKRKIEDYYDEPPNKKIKLDLKYILYKFLFFYNKKTVAIRT
jgi:hypothetical protein